MTSTNANNNNGFFINLSLLEDEHINKIYNLIKILEDDDMNDDITDDVNDDITDDINDDVTDNFNDESILNH